MRLRPLSPGILVVGVLLSTLGLGVPAAGAQDVTVQAAANQFGSGRTSFGYTVDPGGTVRDAIVVVNHGASPRHLAVRADGKGIAAWVHPDADTVTVAPGASAQVPFTLTLPKRAAPGDYAGRIAGLPVRLRVGGPLKPSLAVDDVRIHDASVTFTVRNTGNAILTARPNVSVSGPFGRWKAHAARVADSPPLLPGEAWQGWARLHDVTPALRLTATVALTPLLTDDAGSISPLAPTEATGHAWAIPWLPLMGLAVVGGLVAAGLKLRPRRRMTA